MQYLLTQQEFDNLDRKSIDLTMMDIREVVPQKRVVPIDIGQLTTKTFVTIKFYKDGLNGNLLLSENDLADLVELLKKISL